MRKANQRGKSGTPPMEEAEGEGLGGDGAVGAGSGAGGFLARFSTSGTRWAHFEVGPSFNPVEQSCTEVFSRVIPRRRRCRGPSSGGRGSPPSSRGFARRTSRLDRWPTWTQHRRL